MGRVKIDIPGKIIYQIKIPVRITDMNYGNHLGNDALVSILHETRVAWLKALGYSELNIEGVGIIMSDLAVSYINECFYGDILTIGIATGEISRAGFEIYYLAETIREEKKLVIAKAKTGIVCYDYTLRKVTGVPEKFKKILS